jgi:hypothetical protein
MVYIMRTVGMRAFQTILLPHLSGAQIQWLNSVDQDVIRSQAISVESEIERAVAICEPVGSCMNYDIHLAAELMQVLLNLRRWNAEMRTPGGRALWGRRTVKYFVFDTKSRAFAPSKFCAYVPVFAPSISGDTSSGARTHFLMTLELYASLDTSAGKLDGTRAWSHLTRRLAMTVVSHVAAPDIFLLFEEWLDHHRDSVGVHPSGPLILVPPEWLI